MSLGIAAVLGATLWLVTSPSGEAEGSQVFANGELLVEETSGGLVVVENSLLPEIRLGARIWNVGYSETIQTFSDLNTARSEAFAADRFKDERSRRSALTVSNPGSAKKTFDVPTSVLGRIRLRTFEQSPLEPGRDAAPAIPQPASPHEPALPRRKPLSLDVRFNERGAEAFLLWLW